MATTRATPDDKFIKSRSAEDDARPPDVVDVAGNWVFTHELCEACGCPSWDAFPAGIVCDRWPCQRCGHVHQPHKEDAGAEVAG